MELSFERRLRRSAPKSRSGCITCKKRRVKCDEAKPFCMRCISGEWKCDGYQSRPIPHLKKLIARQYESGDSRAELPGSRNTSAWGISISSQRNSLLDFPGTPNEHRSLDYFFSRAARDLGIFVDDTFWSIPASRAAALEKSIQHALIAVARYHEDHVRELEMGGDIDQEMAQPFALTQYNIAIKAVTSALCRDRFGHQTALLACFLFVCLEFFKGSPDTALSQLHSGMMMLATYTRLYRKQNCAIRDVGESDFDAVDNRIADIFSRFRISVLNTTPVLHKFYIPMGDFTRSEKETLAQPFTTISGAKSHLDALIIRTFKPCDSTSQGAILGVLTPEEIVRRRSAISRLENWAKQLGLLMIDTIPSPTLEEIRTVRILRIHSIMGIIWNSVTISGLQTGFDIHIEHFQSLFRLTEQLVLDQIKQAESNTTSTSPPESPPDTQPLDSLYTIQPDPTSPLGFLCARCRHPILRRRAVQLLILMSRLPIWWNALMYAKIADRIISFEESQCLSPLTEDVSTWPKEEQRIHGCFFLPVHDSKGRTQTTMFLWQPGGQGSKLVHWFEKTEFDKALSWRVCFPVEGGGE